MEKIKTPLETSGEDVKLYPKDVTTLQTSVFFSKRCLKVERDNNSLLKQQVGLTRVVDKVEGGKNRKEEGTFASKPVNPWD